MVAIIKSQNSTETANDNNNYNNIEKFSVILNNLKPIIVNNSNSIQAQHSIQSSNNNNNNNEIILNHKSKFKTIKIFIASNKYEFDAENEYILVESQPELQEHFMQYGYDLQFIDINLNLNYDPYKDPYCLKYLIKEIDDCASVSDGVFFITLIGNKYGDIPLPIVLTQNEYQTIHTVAHDTDKDLNLFESWYIIDENSSPIVYRLKNVYDSFPNLHNRSRDNYDVYKTELEVWEDVYSRLIDLIQHGLNHESVKTTSNNKIKPIDTHNQSVLEILTNAALKHSTNELLIINRNYNGLNEKSKNNKFFIDIASNGKIDKVKQQKLVKLNESLSNKVNNENIFNFNLNWNDESSNSSGTSCFNSSNVIDVKNEESLNGDTNDVQKDNNNDNNENNQIHEKHNKTSSKYEEQHNEFTNYLKHLNEFIVKKVGNSIEKRIYDENTFDVNSYNSIVYEEITRHLYKYQKLNEKLVFGLDEMYERVKKLINFAIKNEHYPLFLYGSSASGKTLTLSKFGNFVYNTIGVRSCLIINRYFDLTSNSMTIESLLFSICEQLTILNKLNPAHELPKKTDFNELTLYFHKIIAQLSKGQKQILILIDGLQDIYVDKSLIENTNIINNHLEWLFTLLPPKVHLIVSIKKQSGNFLKIDNNINNNNTTTTTNNNNNNNQLVPSVSQLTLGASLSMNTISLLTYYIDEHLSNVKENYLFELPIQIKISDIKELNVYIKSELNRAGKIINDEQIQIIIDCLNIKSATTPSLAQSTIETLTPYSSIMLSSINLQNETHTHLYLNFLIKHLQKSSNIKSILTSDKIPKDVESLIKLKIERIERIYNQKIASYIFNYITASHNGLTEMELIDILSCNNDFYFDYYTHLQLPTNLKFPIAIWLFIKHELGDFLTQKYVDNKITYCWSYDLIKKLMKQMYFNKVDIIRSCHKDIANYFLESFVETKPLVDMSLNIQIRDEEGKRFVSQQPLLYSEYSYNFRRLNELWYHLMNSGDIQRLKEHAFFNFEYLLAKCHGISLQNLLNDVDCVLKRILDVDILLLNSLLKKSINTLSNDPLKLASEILLKLRSLKDDYGVHVKGLIDQAIEWCENYTSPLLIPLSCWLESPENLLITKIDNQDGILKMAITSFNQHVFFSTNKNEICMHHVPSKKLVKKFIGHSDTINSLQVSHNNRFLVSASSDQYVKVWNLATGDVENTFINNKSPILCSVLTHSDEIIITGCKNHLINLTRIDTGELICAFDKHEDAITSLAVSLDDKILISASLDKTIKRWSLIDMDLIENIANILSPCTNMTITCDNVFIIAGCANNTVQVKSLITGNSVHDLVGHNAHVTALAASSDCKNVFVGCSDSKLYIYDIKSKELVAVFMEQESSINDLKISSDGSFLFSASGNSLYVFNLKKQNIKLKNNNEASKSLINCFDISKEGDVAIIGDNLGCVKLWNLDVGEVTETIMEYQNSKQVTLSHSYLFSVSAFNDGLIQVYDNEMGEIIVDFREHDVSIRYLRILDDNHRVLSADVENHIKVWWSNTGVLTDSFTVPCQLISCSGQYVASGSGDNTLKIWHLGDAKVVRQIDHPDKITTMVFTQDSNHLITGGEDGSCKIWETSTGKLVQVLVEHENGITTVAVSNPSNYVVSGSKDKQVIFWSFKDGSVIHKLIGHLDIIIKVTVTPEATVIFSASKDGHICIWSGINGKLLHNINTQYTIADMLVSLSGSRIIARFSDSPSLAVFSLNNKPVINLDNKTLSHMNLKMFEQNDKKVYPKVLPIKPKPLILNKQTVSRLSKSNFMNKLRKQSNITDIIQNEPLSASHNTNGAKDFFKRKNKRRKDNRSNDFSSTLSIVPNGENKHKKTKICCLL